MPLCGDLFVDMRRIGIVRRTVFAVEKRYRSAKLKANDSFVHNITSWAEQVYLIFS